MAVDYNGWSNYETWVTNLWMEQSYHHWAYFSEMVWKETKDSLQARIDLVDSMKRTFEGMAPDLPASPYSDLLNSAMSEIDWYEIADSWLENANLEGYEPRKVVKE